MTPIDYTQPARRLREALNEFLKTWFDGAAHSTPTGNRTFPAVDILFNQAALPDSTKPQLHIVWSQPRLRQQSCGIRTISVTGSATTYTGQCDEVTGPWDLQIYVRVKDTGTGNASSHLCTNVADNLTELLQSSEVHELTNAGFTNLTILSGPVPLSAAGWQMCMFTVRGTIVYYVPRG